MKNWTIWILHVTICLFWLVQSSVYAQDNQIKREILALHDPRDEAEVYRSNIHQYAEMPLNHVGLSVIHRSVLDPLPDDQAMRDFRGILTWFTHPNAVPDPARYCQWLSHQLSKGRRVVIMNNWGIYGKSPSSVPSECRDFLRKLGAELIDHFVDDPLTIEIYYQDPSMLEFERRLHPADGWRYNQFRVINSDAKSYLKARLKGENDSEADLAFSSPNGGLVYGDYALYANQVLKRAQWLINPFKFFERAFGLEGLPRPDTTTLNGVRLFYSHIDGDGIFNISHLDRKSFSGEIILDRVIKTFYTVPITVSLITGYMDQRRYQSERVHQLYTDLFSAPNVEPAAHGYAHPLIWSQRTLALDISGYEFDPVKEIRGAIQMVQDFLIENNLHQSAQLMLWTGDCFPNESEIGLTYQNNLLNMNGGDSRFDRLFNSYRWVGPLGLLRGRYRQIYSANSNENTYTNLWQGPYYGFSMLAETFRNTESPIRIKPMNIYYHFYSGEKHASLKALLENYQFALSQPVYPLRASNYARLVEDFFRVRMEVAHRGWRIQNNGALRTLRFDQELRHVDFGSSNGVIGQWHYQGNLYVHLDEADDHLVVLVANAPRRPHIKQASFEVREFTVERGEVRFTKRGWYRSWVSLAGMAPSKIYRVMSGDGHQEVRSDAQGELMIEFDEAENGGAATVVVIKEI